MSSVTELVADSEEYSEDHSNPQQSQVLILAAFIEYIAPAALFPDDLSHANATLLTKARQLLFPTAAEGTSRWNVLTSGALADVKLVILAYSWLTIHCHDSHIGYLWFESLFAGAPCNLAFATSFLTSFDTHAGSVYNSKYPAWKSKYSFKSLDCPSMADGKYSGAFSQLADDGSALFKDPRKLGFHGPSGSRNHAPLNGMYHCAKALNVEHPQRFRVWPPLPLPKSAADLATLPDTSVQKLPNQHLADPVDEQNPLATIPVQTQQVTQQPAMTNGKPALPVQVRFEYHLQEFELFSSSPAAIWLHNHLSSTQLHELYTEERLPMEYNLVPFSIKPNQPVLDHHGFPWFKASGELVYNQSSAAAYPPSRAETQAFYRSSKVPVGYLPRAPTVPTGFYAHEPTIYCGMGENTDDEEEPYITQVRHSTRYSPPPTFTGDPAKQDFIAWLREIDTWWQVDNYPLYTRTSHAAARLQEEAAIYWRRLAPEVLQFYTKRGKHKDPSGKPYVPYTAFKKVMAHQYASIERLRELKAKLRTLIREPEQHIQQFQNRFTLLVADIATYGLSHAVPEPEQVELYLSNSHVGLPHMHQDAEGSLVPWTCIETLMTAAHMEYLKINAPPPAALAALPHKQQPRQQAKPRTPRTPRTPRQQQQHQQNRNLNLSAIQETLTSLLASVTDHGKRRAPFPDRDAPFKRPRYPSQPGTKYRTPPSGQRHPRGPPDNPQQQDGKCPYCRLGHHPESRCYKKKRDNANIAAGRPPSPFGRDRR
jgi:hypothetical protein